MDKLREYTISLDATLLDAAQRINRNRSRAVMAVDDGKVIGIIGEGDIMRALLQGVDIHAPLAPFIQSGFKFLRRKDYAQALGLFAKHGITMLPVLDDALRLQDVLLLTEVLAQLTLKIPSE